MKQSFANTLAELGGSGAKYGNECERFGMTWGCRPDCPVFERGECEQQELNQKIFDDEENNNTGN